MDKIEIKKIGDLIVSKIISNDKIPQDMKDKEIVHDVVFDVIVDLMQSHDSKKSSLETYLWNFTEMRAVKKLWSRYRHELKMVNLDEVDSMDDEGNYVTNSAINKAAQEKWVGDWKRFEDKDSVRYILTKIETEEESEILRMIADGKTIRDIAFELYDDENKKDRVIRRLDSVRKRIGGEL